MGPDVTTPARGAETFDVLDPRTGRVLAVLPVQGPDEIRQAVATARTAQAEWGAMAPHLRARIEGSDSQHFLIEGKDELA